jgi:hypothetical protein
MMVVEVPWRNVGLDTVSTDLSLLCDRVGVV